MSNIKNELVKVRVGGNSANFINSYVVVGVNTILLPTSLNGVKWVAETPTNTTQDLSVLSIAALTPISPPGIGIAQNVQTLEFILIANVGGKVPWYTDLINGSIISLGSKTVSITGVPYTDPITHLEVTPVYTAYVPYMRY